MNAELDAPARTTQRLWFVAAACVVAHALWHGWVQDDAFFSIRMVQNAVDGHGLVWNRGERVLGVTHPAWMLLQIPTFAITRSPMGTLLFTCLCCTAAMLWMSRRIATTSAQALWLLFVLFSTQSLYAWLLTGLENPLTFFAVLWFAHTHLTAPGTPQGTRRVALGAALLILCRYDPVLLAVPALVMRLAQGRSWAHVRALATGLLPAVTWVLFTIIYYGHPLPNTALAKAFHGVPLLERIQGGLAYGWVTILYDPMSPFLVLAGCVTLWRGSAASRTLVLGACLHIAYVISIGGDYLLGRYFGPGVLLCAVVVGQRAQGPAMHHLRTLAVITALLGAGLRTVWITEDERYPSAIFPGTVDILVNFSARHTRWDDWHIVPHAPLAPPTVYIGILGRGALGLGPDDYSVEPWALVDPLLARVPLMEWSPGHGTRAFPRGYIDVLRGERDHLPDPLIDRLLVDLHTVHRGPLFTLDRARAMLRLWTGHPGLAALAQYADPTPIARGPLATGPAGDPFGIAGVLVHAATSWTSPGITITLDGDHTYDILCRRQDNGQDELLTTVPTIHDAAHRVLPVDIAPGTACAALLVRGTLLSDQDFVLGDVTQRAP